MEREHKGSRGRDGSIRRSSHLLLRPFLPSTFPVSWSREGRRVKRIVKRTKEFNGIREACRGQGSMPEIPSTAIVPRFRGNKTISASVFSSPLPFSPPPPLNLSNNPALGKRRKRHLEREKGKIMNFCPLPSSYYFALFKISSPRPFESLCIERCKSFSSF